MNFKEYYRNVFRKMINDYQDDLKRREELLDSPSEKYSMSPEPVEPCTYLCRNDEYYCTSDVMHEKYDTEEINPQISTSPPPVEMGELEKALREYMAGYKLHKDEDWTKYYQK